MRDIYLKHAFSIVLLTCLLSWSCSNKTEAYRSGSDNSNTPITFKNGIAKLKFGQVGLLDAKDLSLAFTKVTNDSRCPKGLECIQQGHVLVELALKKEGKVIEIFILSDRVEESVKEIGDLVIKLKSVSPYPEFNKKIDVADYVLLLEKSKK